MRLSWAKQAETDLYEISDHYGQFHPDLSDDLLDRPWIGPPVGFFGLRKWLVRRTPFLLLYRVRDEEVEIARVLHGAADWKSLL